MSAYGHWLISWLKKSTLRDFLVLLCDIFAKEPPVIARQPPRQVQTPQPAQTPLPVPPLPPQATSTPASHGQPRPPPPPPKATYQEGQQHSTPVQYSANPSTVSQPSSRYQSAPPLPPEAAVATNAQSTGPVQGQFQPNMQIHTPSHMSPIPTTTSNSQYPSPGGQEISHFQSPAQVHIASHGQWQQPGYQQPPGPPQSVMVRNQGSAFEAPHTQNTAPPPPPDLLDEPLTLELPGQTSVAPPPIPPNPEKDALLRQLALTLASMRRQSRQQNESSMAGLHAQRTAMLSTLPTMQSEMGQLTQLSNVLTSNTAILHEALHKADGVIEGSKNHPAPNIDELLVAPTVVANQLYTLVAEERALSDAVFMLGRAVERGRITPAVFAKMTRSLAREWHLKSALVRKIGLGMGLWT